MNEQRYKKVGKRYVPVAVHEACDEWAPGSYLVTVSNIRSGGRSYHSLELKEVQRDTLGLLAAAQALQDRLTDIVYQADSLRLSPKATPAQQKAWRAMEKAGINTIYRQSSANTAGEILAAIVEAADAKRKATAAYAG